MCLQWLCWWTPGSGRPRICHRLWITSVSVAITIMFCLQAAAFQKILVWLRHTHEEFVCDCRDNDCLVAVMKRHQGYVIFCSWQVCALWPWRSKSWQRGEVAGTFHCVECVIRITHNDLYAIRMSVIVHTLYVFFVRHRYNESVYDCLRQITALQRSCRGTLRMSKHSHDQGGRADCTNDCPEQLERARKLSQHTQNSQIESVQGDHIQDSMKICRGRRPSSRNIHFKCGCDE